MHLTYDPAICCFVQNLFVMVEEVFFFFGLVRDQRIKDPTFLVIKSCVNIIEFYVFCLFES